MRWNLKGLVFAHFFALFLIITFFWDTTFPYWQKLDGFCFSTLNQTMMGHPWAQKFWAFQNLRVADWIEDLVFFFFFIAYVRSFAKKEQFRKICELSICVLFCAFIILYVNHEIFRSWCRFKRLSPSMIFPNIVDVSSALPGIFVKIGSNSSFPGDHATTAFFFPIILTYLKAPKKLLLFAWLYTVFLCLPRIIVGAHWVSDILVGSLNIVLIFSSYLFYSPLFNWCTTHLIRMVLYIKNKGRHEQPSI